jgi:hypothetical protein
MKNTTAYTILILIITFFLSKGCTKETLEQESVSKESAKQYEGILISPDSVFKHIESQLSYGPRNPGSKGHAETMKYLLNYFSNTADTAFLQRFSSTVYGKTYDMANIIASFSPEKSDRILLCAHWDTRPFADEDKNQLQRTNPILGANDGASGVAVLMEIANVLSKQKPDIGIDIILFDGEDLGLSGDLDGFFQGSRYLAVHYPLPKPRYGILLDLVGDKQAEFRYEPISRQAHTVLVDGIWNIAKKSGSPYFIHEIGNSVSDDHVILNQHGIKTINIIDVNLVGNIDPNPRRQYWHTSQDTIDNISSQTLADIGTVLLDFLFTTSQDIF